MRIERPAESRRSPEQWAPFMAKLNKRLHARRKRRTLSMVFAVIALLVFGAFFLLFPLKGRSNRLLLARAPSLSAATFSSCRGTTFVARNVVFIRTEAGP